MAFERPQTVMEALREIDRNHYALPALQREFVWKPEQICTLFDSVMKGYPIGSFLFWKLEPETARQFQFYQFMRDYHERKNPYCDEFPMKTGGPSIAVLDGQQRLTAFNIGVYGSYAHKKKYVRRDNPNAFPVKHLHLNLLVDPQHSDDADVTDYEFKFLTSKEAARRDEHTLWFPVGKMRDFVEPYDCIDYLTELDLGALMKPASRVLNLLHKILHTTPIVSYFQEEAQDLDKVLNIFIRVNSGGTQLGYADLLLSIATTQWKEIDARKAINDLVTTLNSYGVEERFNFSKDFVLKAGLVLAGCSDVKFAASNFTADNMHAIEEIWPKLERSLHVTIELLHQFGFGRHHMRATSSAIAIAAYIYYKGYDSAFLSRQAHADERAEIRRWLVQMNLSGIWAASFADKLLPKLMSEFERAGTFDREGLFELTRKLGRDPFLDDEGIEELLELRYSTKRTFLVLSTLFDNIQMPTSFGEIDHIYPRARTKKRALTKAGFSAEDAKLIEDRANRLPNLWLLSNVTNQEKGKKMPLEWLGALTPETSEYLVSLHHLQDLTEDLEEFNTFYEARKERLRQVLHAALGRPTAPPQVTTTAQAAPAPQAKQTHHDVGTQWSEDILGILEEDHQALAQVLMAAGIPEPEDVDAELVRDGLTTSDRSIMNWRLNGRPVWLLAPGIERGGIAGHVIEFGDDAEATAAALNAALTS